MRRPRLPGKLHAQHPGRKWLAAGVLALLSAGLAAGLRVMPGTSVPLEILDDVFYDAFYQFRTPEDRTNGDVVLVVVDDRTIELMSRSGEGWPFKRDHWGKLVDYLDAAGAKVIAFDLLFETPSQYAKYYEPSAHDPKKLELIDDDQFFSVAINGAAVPVVLAMQAAPDGQPGPMALDVKPARKLLAAVNLRTDTTVRVFDPRIYGQPNLAVRVRELATPGSATPAWAQESFRLHYYGPHLRDGEANTFRYVSLVDVLAAAKRAEGGTDGGATPASAPATSPATDTGSSRAGTAGNMPPNSINPSMFKDKIVLVGAIATATFDLKSSPLSKRYPGVEVQATAIDNLLHDQYVHQAGIGTTFAITFAASLVTAVFILFPRKTLFKLLGSIAAAGALVVGALLAFRGSTIYWLPLGEPLLGLLFAVVGSFAWSYWAEDRNRRLLLRALAQYVSPAVAAEISKDPSRVRLTGDRHVMTVMFTDIEGFTALSEKLPDETLTELLNFYFDEMSPLVLREDGTLDKYIGDSIMSFWNAPLPQADHAFRACRVALALQRREYAIQSALQERGAQSLVTRIGINTGPMVVGDMGSKERFNYTVLGDSVNLGSRLEGANKLYGSRILLSQSTAELVKDQFLMRKLDLLLVKGKRTPLAVYELLGERGKALGEPALLERIKRYETAWELYRQQKWDEAEQMLRALITDHPADAPAVTLLTRIGHLRADPPAGDWDGVYVAQVK